MLQASWKFIGHSRLIYYWCWAFCCHESHVPQPHYHIGGPQWCGRCRTGWEENGVWLNRSKENRRCWSWLHAKEGKLGAWLTPIWRFKRNTSGIMDVENEKNRSFALKIFVFIKAVSSLGLRLGRCSRGKEGPARQIYDTRQSQGRTPKASQRTYITYALTKKEPLLGENNKRMV